MAGSWLDALLGAISNSGVSIPLSGGLNFEAPLTAELNPTTGVVDVSLPDASLDAAGLGVLSAGMAPVFVVTASGTAGAPGTADDVTVLLSAPFAFRILDVNVQVTTGIAASTARLRTATGGGGSTLSDIFDTGSSGTQVRDNTGTPRTVAAGGSIYLRRSDRGVACTVNVICVRV